MTISKETPINIDDLVANANCKHSWRARWAALQELRKYDCQQSRDVITRLALHDKVYKVKQEAFRIAQEFGITKNGRPITLGKKDIGFNLQTLQEFSKELSGKRRWRSLTLSEFKAPLQILNPEMLDVMSFEKDNKLNAWIENTLKSLPKK